MGELTDSYAIKITKGDSSIISASQNRTNDLAFAYILKGAYKGKSAPLALTVHNASFRTTSEVVFNEKIPLRLSKDLSPDKWISVIEGL